MNSPVTPATPAIIGSAAATSASASLLAPASLGQRVWKGFGRTPWWRLILGALIVLISVALFTLPFDSIRLSQQLKSPAARQAFKFAVQKQVLERARAGLVGVRIFTNDPAVDKDIDRAIGDIESALSAERHQVTVSSAAELTALVDSQREDIKKASRALEQMAAKLRANPDAADSEANVEALSSKAEALQNSVEQLQELQAHAKEFADTAKHPNNDGQKITINLFGRAGQPVIGITPIPPLPSGSEPSSLDPGVREAIQTTVGRDANKLILGGASFAVLFTLFLLMLIARAFAGRAAKGEQRAVIAESRERSESYARQLAEARLMVMRAQVEPHFLFNTLAHVQALQEIDPPQAGHMLERLISYLRAAMPTMRETTSTLGREVEVVTAYLDLLKIRMGDRLNYTINVPSELGSISLPPTMIATLVENAIKHGLEAKREGGTVAIQVRQVGEQIEVLVADNGLGLGGADTGGTGVGLANTRERLKMLYGDTGELIVEPNAPTGVRALLRVPKEPPPMVSSELSGDVDSSISPYTVQTAGLLAVFAGGVGVHRFYVGLNRTGVGQAVLGTLSILSGGVPIFLVPLVVWVLLDCVRIVTRDFVDAKGRRIVRLNETDTKRYSATAVRPWRDANASRLSRMVALVLALLLGLVGAHRFYVGRTGSALAMLFTLGGLGIWWLIDIIIVMTGQLVDSEGKRVSEWE